jgi:hypothetical protein
MSANNKLAARRRLLLASGSALVGAGLLMRLPPVLAQQKLHSPSRQDLAAADALLIVTDLRARTQRVARLYLEFGAKTRVEKTGYALAREYSAIEALVVRMQTAKAVQGVRSAERFIERWNELRAPLLAPYSKPNGDLVYALSEELYNHSQKLAQNLESQIASDYALAVDISTRIMAQTERISKALIQSSLSSDRSALGDLESWKKEQVTGLAQLAALRINDDYTRGSLALSDTLAKVYRDYVVAATRSLRPETVTNVAKASDGLWDILVSTRDRYETFFRVAHGLPVTYRG